MNIRTRSAMCIAVAGATLGLMGCSSGNADGLAALEPVSTSVPLEEEAAPPTESNELEPVAKDTMVLSLNGDVSVGSGLVFIEDDGSMLIRGLIGTEEDHYSLNFEVHGFGTHQITTNHPDYGPITRVVGLDAVESVFVFDGSQKATIEVTEGSESGYIVGNFRFTSRSRSSGESTLIEGTFHLVAGSGRWDCDWAGPPAVCGFTA